MLRIIEMTSCGIAAKISFIVLGTQVHLDITVPMITICIRGLVKQSVVGSWQEATAGCSFLHAVTYHAGVMKADIGNSAVVNWGGDI